MDPLTLQLVNLGLKIGLTLFFGYLGFRYIQQHELRRLVIRWMWGNQADNPPELRFEANFVAAGQNADDDAD